MKEQQRKSVINKLSNRMPLPHVTTTFLVKNMYQYARLFGGKHQQKLSEALRIIENFVPPSMRLTADSNFTDEELSYDFLFSTVKHFSGIILGIEKREWQDLQNAIQKFLDLMMSPEENTSEHKESSVAKTLMISAPSSTYGSIYSFNISAGTPSTQSSEFGAVSVDSLRHTPEGKADFEPNHQIPLAPPPTPASHRSDSPLRDAADGLHLD